MGWLRKASLACALWSAAHGQVTLDFQSLSLLDCGIIPSNYGSNLTPNLTGIAYRTFTVAIDATLTNYLEFWNTGYGDLTKVAFASSNGYAVRLISFDIAGWPTTDRTNTHMRLLDAAGATLVNYAAAGSIRIQWGNDWNVGIDNIQFHVVPIPEPPAWMLLALGGTAGAWWLRRRRRAESNG